MKIALIDDDPVEEVILTGLAESLETPASFTAFKTLEAFLDDERVQDFDVVFLDRRIPPYDDFSQTLPKLATANITARIVLLTAHRLGHVEAPPGLDIVGQYEKADVLEPDVCQSASKIDPLSARNIAPPCAQGSWPESA